MKMEPFPKTWTMCKSSGGAGGVSGVVSETPRQPDVHGGRQLSSIESVFLNNRADMKEHMKLLSHELKIPEQAWDELFEKQWKTRLYKMLH